MVRRTALCYTSLSLSLTLIPYLSAHPKSPKLNKHMKEVRVRVRLAILWRWGLIIWQGLGIKYVSFFLFIAFLSFMSFPMLSYLILTYCLFFSFPLFHSSLILSFPVLPSLRCWKMLLLEFRDAQVQTLSASHSCNLLQVGTCKWWVGVSSRAYHFYLCAAYI